MQHAERVVSAKRWRQNPPFVYKNINVVDLGYPEVFFRINQMMISMPGRWNFLSIFWYMGEAMSGFLEGCFSIFPTKWGGCNFSEPQNPEKITRFFYRISSTLKLPDPPATPSIALDHPVSRPEAEMGWNHEAETTSHQGAQERIDWPFKFLTKTKGFRWIWTKKPLESYEKTPKPKKLKKNEGWFRGVFLFSFWHFQVPL